MPRKALHVNGVVQPKRNAEPVPGRSRQPHRTPAARTARTARTAGAGPLRHVRVRIGHARRPGDTPHDVFMRHIEIEGDLADDQRRRLMEIADRCPLHNTVEQGAQVRTQAVRTSEARQGVESAGPHARDMEGDMVASGPPASIP